MKNVFLYFLLLPCLVAAQDTVTLKTSDTLIINDKGQQIVINKPTVGDPDTANVFFLYTDYVLKPTGSPAMVQAGWLVVSVPKDQPANENGVLFRLDYFTLDWKPWPKKWRILQVVQ